MRSELDQEKAIEVLLYVSTRLDGDIYASLKAIYEAEKHHLENFGSQLYGETFFALPDGPVPSLAYDITKAARRPADFLEINSCENFQNAFENKSCTNHSLAVARDANLELLSKSDLTALDVGVSACLDKSFGQIRKQSHDAPYDATSRNCRMSLDAIARSLPRGEMVSEHLRTKN